MPSIICNIVMHDNTITRCRIKNPKQINMLRYMLDSEYVEKPYKFNYDHVYRVKRPIGYRYEIFYAEGKLNPLKPDFNYDRTDTGIVSDIISSSLFRQLIASTRSVNPMPFIYLILIGVGILISAIIVLNKLGVI